MHDAVWGEKESQRRGRFECWDCTGAETLEGSLRTPSRACARGAERRQAAADRDSGAPVALRETAGRWSAREETGRNPGQGCRERTLEGENPGELPAVDVLNPRLVARDSREDKPRNRGPQGRASCLGRWLHLREETVSGCVEAETLRRLPGRRKLRRVNPRSAAGVRQNRRGIEGSKPPRGWPNPEGGT